MTRAHSTADRLAAMVNGPAIGRLSRTIARIPDGIAGAYVDAFSDRRVAWASPAIITVGAYLGFYGMGVAFADPTPHLPAIAYAVALGLVGLVAGIGLGWNLVAKLTPLHRVDRRSLTAYGVLLLTVGLLALVGYFVAIGYLPLFAADLEQGRVLASEEGGAPLRVLSLLALPGSWILVAGTFAKGDRHGMVLSTAAVIIVAVCFALTGNRSPAFTVVEVAVIVGMLAAGKERLGIRGVTVLAMAAIVLVVGAGLFGAFRLASRADVYGPPVPGVRPAAPDYVRLTPVAIKGYLVVPVQNLGYTLDAIPSALDWRYGLTYLQPVVTILPGRQTTFDADLKAALGQRYAGGGTVPGLLGEAYANFGLFGWFAVPLVIGAAVTALYRASRSWAPERTALYGYAIAHVSLGAPLSGLAVASIFPYEAYFFLGFAILGLPIIESRLAARRG